MVWLACVLVLCIMYLPSDFLVSSSVSVVSTFWLRTGVSPPPPLPFGWLDGPFSFAFFSSPVLSNEAMIESNVCDMIIIYIVSILSLSLFLLTCFLFIHSTLFF